MKKEFILAFLSIVLFFNTETYAQKKKNVATEKTGHELIFNIEGAKDHVLYLAIHYKGQLILKDSALSDIPGRYIFKGEEPYDEGLFTLVSSKKTPYLNFIIDRNQHFEFFIDTTNIALHFSVKNSPHNEEVLAFQKQAYISQKTIEEYQKKIVGFEGNSQIDSTQKYKEAIRTVNDNMNQFISDLIDRNPDYLFSKMQKAYLPIDVPEPPVKADGSIDSNFQAIYYRTHYWDNVDLSDRRFIYIPAMETKYNEYFKRVLMYQETDTIIRYVNLFLDKLSADSLMYRYYLERLTFDYQDPKVIGYDAVFVNITRNNHLAGKTPWMDEDLLNKFRKRTEDLEKTLIGRKATELIMSDTTGNRWISSHQLPDEYVILWFYDPTCGTCKKEGAKLYHLYDSLTKAGTRNFEVYAICNDSDLSRWKKYLKDNNYKWVNVGGYVANVDYREAYAINSNPSMFILNKNREIILNKLIDMEMIPLFFEQYELRQKLRSKK